MKVRIYLIVLILALGKFNGYAQYRGDQVVGKTREIIIGKVKEVPEVKKYMHDYSYIKPQIFLARTPLPGFNYYLVMVGMGEHDNTFQASFNFCIEPKSFKLYYLDKMADMVDPKNAVITLEQWRNVRSTPNFIKMHTYQNGKLVLMQSHH